MIGWIYLILSGAALLFWRTDLQQLCNGENCASSFLGRSWFLWGAIFYATTAGFCLHYPKNRKVGAFLSAGALLHVVLIAYRYAATKYICPVCWKFAVMVVLLTVCYFLLPDRGKKAALSIPAWVMVAVGIVLFAVNPSAPPAGDKQYTLAPVRVADADPCDIQVVSIDGTQVCLNVKDRPALFFAVWCPHCKDALQEISGLPPEKRPYIIVTYLQDGDLEKVPAKLAENGLAGEKYYSSQKPPDEIQGVPALLWWDGELKYREGDNCVEQLKQQ